MKNATNTSKETAYVSKEEYDDLLGKYRDVAGQLAELKRLIFGSKSERFVSTTSPGQLGLFGEASQESSSSAAKEVLRETKIKVKLDIPMMLTPRSADIDPLVDFGHDELRCDKITVFF